MIVNCVLGRVRTLLNAPCRFRAQAYGPAIVFLPARHPAEKMPEADQVWSEWTEIRVPVSKHQEIRVKPALHAATWRGTPGRPKLRRR